jgi:thioredoxin reductase (NADPH)
MKRKLGLATSRTNQEILRDVAIIGAGPVGLFCVFELGMLGMSSVVIDALPHVGGQCSALYPQKPIYDIPGYPVILGNELIEKLMQQAAPFNPEYILDVRVDSLVREDKAFKLTTREGVVIRAKVIIIAAGCGAFGPNKPPLENIERFEQISVFYSVLDKSRFKDANIVIAGGGDSALDWTLTLAEIAAKIYVVHRRDVFRGMENTLKKIKDYEAIDKVEFVIPYQLHRLQGDNGKLEVVEVIDLDNNIRKLEADFLLPFFGLKMDIGPIVDWGLDIDARHIIVDPGSMVTNIPGVFAIGDIASYAGKLKLILTGFAEAAHAAHSAYEIVFPDKVLHFQYSTAKGVPANG